jgi:mannose-6-phosphate isomerase
VLGPNQPPQFYRGGAGIARLRGTPQPSAYAPEDWVGSTTSIFSRPGLGLSRLPDGSTLRSAIEAAPEAFLGPDHVARYGADPALLVKILDTGERLVVHFHPDRDFAARHLGSRYGKTEAWIILDASPAACVYLGFKQDTDLAVVRRWVAGQDTAAILGSLNKVPVAAGDTWLVPAGVPHAIGAGITLVELQEPTDFSILLEWAGFLIDGPREGHLGLGFDVALTALDVSGWDQRRLDALHAPRPDAAARPFVTRLLPARADAFFRASLVDVAGPVVFEPGYAILVVVVGEGRLAYPAGTLPVRRGSTVLVPYGAGPTTLDGHFQALRCRPPVSLLLSPLPGVLRALWGKRTKQCGRRYSHDRRADLEQRPQPVRQPLLGAAARVAL